MAPTLSENSLARYSFHPLHRGILNVGTNAIDGTTVWATSEAIKPQSRREIRTMFFNDELKIKSERLLNIIWRDEFDMENFPGRTLREREQDRRTHCGEISRRHAPERFPLDQTPDYYSSGHQPPTTEDGGHLEQRLPIRRIRQSRTGPHVVRIESQEEGLFPGSFEDTSELHTPIDEHISTMRGGGEVIGTRTQTYDDASDSEPIMVPHQRSKRLRRTVEQSKTSDEVTRSPHRRRRSPSDDKSGTPEQISMSPTIRSRKRARPNQSQRQSSRQPSIPPDSKHLEHGGQNVKTEPVDSPTVSTTKDTRPELDATIHPPDNTDDHASFPVPQTPIKGDSELPPSNQLPPAILRVSASNQPDRAPASTLLGQYLSMDQFFSTILSEGNMHREAAERVSEASATFTRTGRSNVFGIGSMALE